MQLNNNADKGRAGLSLAIAYYGSNGYTVSVPLNDTQWYDLVVEKDGVFQTVQCKFTASKDNTINFRSTGGTKGSEYDNLLKHPVDLLFCSDARLNLYSIPLEDIRKSGNQNSIILRTEANTNKQGFQSYKYLVYI